MTIAPKIKSTPSTSFPHKSAMKSSSSPGPLRRRQTRPAALLDDTLAGILAHRSVRGYLPTPLPQGALELIVAAAQSAATSSNLQAWSVVAVKDKDRKSRLAALAGNQKHIEQTPLFLRILADLSVSIALRKIAGRPLEAP